MKYILSLEDEERLENEFTYHPPFGDQPERYKMIRDKAKEMARLIMELCPNSRERSLAMTALEDCVMRANRAIALNEREQP